MIKLYGKAAEIFEESLITFAIKIIGYLVRILKENEPQYHFAIAYSVGMVVKNVISKIDSPEEQAHNLSEVLKVFLNCLHAPSQILQVGASLCLEQTVQSMP